MYRGRLNNNDTKMGKQLGLGVGISSSANILEAILVQLYLGDNVLVVTILSGSNKKYLKTDLVNDQPIREGYLSPQT